MFVLIDSFANTFFPLSPQTKAFWKSQKSITCFSQAITSKLGHAKMYFQSLTNCVVPAFLSTCFIFLCNPQSPEEGASTLIYAAVSPELEGVGGCYLYNDQRTKSVDVSYDEEVQKRLWTESCKLVGIPDTTP